MTDKIAALAKKYGPGTIQVCEVGNKRAEELIDDCCELATALARIEAQKQENEKTLRDEFAMAVLTGLIMNNDHSLFFKPEDDAKYCYDIANAMMEERKK